MNWTGYSPKKANIEDTEYLISRWERYARMDSLPTQEEFVDELLAQFDDKGYLTEKQYDALAVIVAQIEEWNSGL